MRLRSLAQAGGDGDPQGAQGAGGGAQGHAGAAEATRRCAGTASPRKSRRRGKKFGSGAAGRAPHRAGRAAAGGGGGDRGLRRARADHRHPVGEGLDPRGEGPRRRCRRAEIQGRRPAAFAAALLRPPTADAVRDQRPGLHAEGRRPAARPRRRPAGAAAGRTVQRGRRRRAVRADGGRASYLVASIDRARLHRAGSELAGGEAHRQAGAEPEAGRGGRDLRARPTAITSR